MWIHEPLKLIDFRAIIVRHRIRDCEPLEPASQTGEPIEKRKFKLAQTGACCWRQRVSSLRIPSWSPKRAQSSEAMHSMAIIIIIMIMIISNASLRLRFENSIGWLVFVVSLINFWCWWSRCQLSSLLWLARARNNQISSLIIGSLVRWMDRDKATR